MTSVANLQPEPAPITACTISRDVQNFDLLIDDMELELGESWGDLSFEDALTFLDQPEAASLEFVAIAVDGRRRDGPVANHRHHPAPPRRKGIKVILIADQISPAGLHQLLRLGADDFVPYPAARRRPARGDRTRCAARPRPPAAQAARSPARRPRCRPADLQAKGDRDGVVLPVHGLSGGVGATTFAVNLAWELATIERRRAARLPDRPSISSMDRSPPISTCRASEAVFEILSDTGAADSDAFLRGDADLQRQAACPHRAGRHAAAG
jgi:pilus assembly protein CpaE